MTSQEREDEQPLRFERLPADWDGEGAYATVEACARNAERFAAHIAACGVQRPEPMHHAAGTVGLFWNVDDFYGDVEFSASGRIVYYLERGAERFRGEVYIDSPGELVELLREVAPQSATV